MKFLIKTKQIVLNQTWLVNEILVSFVWGAEEVWQSLLSGCWLWYPPAGSFSFSQHVHNRLWTIFVLIWEQKAFLSDFPPLVLSSACIYFPGPSFVVGCAALETSKPMCVVLGKSCSHEFFPKYCQELLGRQIIPLREVRHHSFFFSQCLCHSKMQLPHVWLVCVPTLKGWEVCVGCGGLCSGLSIFVSPRQSDWYSGLIKSISAG